jgi:hypothetical protein
MRTTDTTRVTTLWITVALLVGPPTHLVAQPSEKLTPAQAREEIAYTVGVSCGAFRFSTPAPSSRQASTWAGRI